LITLRKLRDLDLAAPASPGRPAYLSAASGLVRRGKALYVIADDEHHLGVFGADDLRPGTLLELIGGDLPNEHEARKKAKPDFESLTLLPAFAGFPEGALLACGSGSKPNRRNGVLVGLAGAIFSAPRAVDLSFLMTPLAAEFGKVNIEGMVVAGNELRVLQRGNKGHRRNAVVRFSLAEVLDALAGGGQALAPLAVTDYDLGSIDGIPLTFTDAANLPSGAMVFSAVAEDTDDAYADGRCAGTAIGQIGADGALKWVEPVSEVCKVEGVALRGSDGDELLLVTDADDMAIPAKLFAAKIERA
jgi:hypothetical protein